MNPELDQRLVGEQQQSTETAGAEPTLTFTVTVNEINVILASLQELPHKVADPILRKLFSQGQAQLQQQSA